MTGFEPEERKEMRNCNGVSSNWKNVRLTYILIKRKKYDKLDTANFEKWFVGSKIFSKLDVELNKTIHGNCDCHTVKHEYPYMSKGRTERFVTIAANQLGN
jgi:hypothetical protein